MSVLANQLVNQGWPQTVADALILPRPQDQFTGSFGPSTPATPTPLDIMRDGMFLPRRSQYPVGYNLPSQPGAYKLIDFKTLRSLAHIYDILRRCIEIRKGEVATMEWEVTYKDPAKREAHHIEARARSRRVAAGQVIGTQEYTDDDTSMMELSEFWEQPDPIRQLGLDDWLKMLIEEVIVVDALSIFPHPTWMPGKGRLGSDLYALEILPGDTIKPLIDVRGAPPMPPAPAYQQYLWGIARTELQQEIFDRQRWPVQSPPPAEAGSYDDSVTDDGYFSKVADHGRLDRPALYYRPFNPQTDSLYGFSMVEQIILTVNLALKRQQWWTNYFTDGTIPAGLLHVPDDWPTQAIREFEENWNALLAGEPAWKHRVKAVPGSHGFTQLKPMIGTDAGITAFDEWLARLTCIGIDVTPDEVGLQPRSGLGGGGYGAAQENVTYRKSLKPLTNWIQVLARRVNTLHFRQSDKVLMFLYEEAEDALKHAQEDEVLIRTGVKTQDECRQDRGLDSHPRGIGSKPMIIVRNGAVLLEDVDDMSQTLASGMQGPPQPGGGPQDRNLPGVPKIDSPSKAENNIESKPTPESQAKDLRLWRTQAIRRLKVGRTALDPPLGSSLHPAVVTRIRMGLRGAVTPDAVRSVFADFDSERETEEEDIQRVS
jgi:hypothetical protein